MKLKDSGVVFEEIPHLYWLGHLDLQGITSTLIPAVFGDYTKNVPPDVLVAAAERGTAIHKAIALLDEGKGDPDFKLREEVMYLNLRTKLGLKPVRSEYIVTDGEHFASAIDKVYEGDIIADIKTTAEIHWSEVIFQLSWYATYYHELNGRPVQKAYVIWLPKEQYDAEGRIYEVQLVDESIVRDVVRTYLAGEDVTCFAHHFERKLDLSEIEEVLQKLIDSENKIKALKEQQKQLEEVREAFNKMAIQYFVASGEKKIDYKDSTITYIAPTTRVSIDSKALKADHPDIYDAYKRESVVRETIRITLNKK